MKFIQSMSIPTYIQGKGALEEIKRFLFPYGQRILFFIGCGASSSWVKALIEESFSRTSAERIRETEPGLRALLMQEAEEMDSTQKSFSLHFENVDGMTVCRENIDTLLEQTESFQADVIVAVGGGRAMDISRAVCGKRKVPLILVPSTCATNASGTSLSVLYNRDSTKIEDVLFMPDYHAMLLVDPELIIKAPAATFASGIGDCLAAYYEAIYSSQAVGDRDLVSQFSWGILENSARVLLERGIKGYHAARVHEITNDYEICLEQISLANGIASMAVSADNIPHLLDEALISHVKTRHFLHGQHVGYGVTALLTHYGAPLEELYQYVDFARQIGIPVTMAEIGLDGFTDDELLRFCEIAAYGTQASNPFLVKVHFTAETLRAAIKTADALVTAYLSH